MDDFFLYRPAAGKRPHEDVPGTHATLDEAEHAARDLIKHKGWAEVAIYCDGHNLPVANVRRDALDRVWTDVMEVTAAW
jgi:hypothetical protein